MTRNQKKAKVGIDPLKVEQAFKSVEEGDIETLRKVIEEEPKVINKKDEDDVSLLYLAVARNNKEMVELLLEKGADTESKSYFGSTPLHRASYDVNLEMVELLLEKGANIKVLDDFNNTVLHSAASGIISEGSNEDWGVVEYLLEKGAPTSITTERGYSVNDIFLSKDWSYAETYEKIKRGEIKTKWDEKKRLEEELRRITAGLLPEENISNYSLVKSLMETIVIHQKKLVESGDESARISLEATKEFAISKGLEREKIEEFCQKLAELAEITVKKNTIEFIEEQGKPWMIKFN